MKYRYVFLLRLMIILTLCASSSSTLAENESSEGSSTITPNFVVFSKGIYTLSVYLEGSVNQENQIIAEHYNKNGDMQEKRVYSCINNIEMSFSNISFSDYVKIYWLDAAKNQCCEPVIVPFNEIHTLDWMDLADALLIMSSEFTGKVELRTDDSTFSSGRLIVKVEGDLPNLSSFQPEVIIVDEENHCYIQFLRDEDAINCEKYLLTLENVIYVEPDNSVYATEDSAQELETSLSADGYQVVTH